MANAWSGRLAQHDSKAVTRFPGRSDRDDARGLRGSDSVEVKRLSSVRDLESISEFWRILDKRISADKDCFLAGLEGNGAKPHVFVLSRRGEPVALALGREVREKVAWRLGYLAVPGGPVRYLEFPADSLIGAHDDQTSAVLLKAVDDCLARTRMAFAKFTELDVRHPVFQALEDGGFAMTRDPVNEVAVHWHLALPESFDAFYKSRSRNVKNNIKTHQNRLTKAFGDKIKFYCLRQPEEVEAAARIAEQLTSKSYQRGLGVGFSDSPAQRKWWQSAAERGWLRIYVLELEGRPAAYWAGTVYAGVFTVDFTSFDPQYARYHPGQVALIKMIEAFCSDPEVRRIDYGFGEAAYKERFGNHCQSGANVYHFARRVRGQAWRSVRLVVSGGHKLIRSGLKRAELLDRFRTLWRSVLMRCLGIGILLEHPIDIARYSGPHPSIARGAVQRTACPCPGSLAFPSVGGKRTRMATRLLPSYAG